MSSRPAIEREDEFRRMADSLRTARGIDSARVALHTASRRLCEIGQIDDEIRCAMGQGVGPSVIELMAKYPSDLSISLSGASAVHALAQNITNSALLGSSAAWAPVMRAMETFSDSEEAQVYGCSALLVLAADDANCEKMAAAAAHKSALKAISLFPKCEEAQTTAIAVMML